LAKAHSILAFFLRDFEKSYIKFDSVIVLFSSLRKK